MGQARSAGNDMLLGSQLASESQLVKVTNEEERATQGGFLIRSTNQHRVFSRAYVQMKTAEDLAEFAHAYDGHGFRGKDGAPVPSDPRFIVFQY